MVTKPKGEGEGCMYTRKKANKWIFTDQSQAQGVVFFTPASLCKAASPPQFGLTGGSTVARHLSPALTNWHVSCQTPLPISSQRAESLQLTPECLMEPLSFPIPPTAGDCLREGGEWNRINFHLCQKSRAFKAQAAFCWAALWHWKDRASGLQCWSN